MSRKTASATKKATTAKKPAAKSKPQAKPKVVLETKTTKAGDKVLTNTKLHGKAEDAKPIEDVLADIPKVVKSLKKGEEKLVGVYQKEGGQIVQLVCAKNAKGNIEQKEIAV